MLWQGMSRKLEICPGSLSIIRRAEASSLLQGEKICIYQYAANVPTCQPVRQRCKSVCAVVTCTCDDCCQPLFLSRGLFELSRFRCANKADINQTRLDKHLWLAARLMFMPLVV